MVCGFYKGQAWTWINDFKKEPMRGKLKILELGYSRER